VPGVWFRLLSQATLGLHTLHQAGLVHGHLTAGQILLTGEGTIKICGAGEPGWLAVPPVIGEEDPAADVLALGRIAAGWTEGETGRRGVRPKPLPQALQAVRHRLLAESAEERYPDTSVLQEDLERIGNDVPTNAAAWERLLAQVRTQTAHVDHRLSA
jgi:hypothetical protein